MAARSTPAMRQVHRQRSIDGLYTIDPADQVDPQHFNGLYTIDPRDHSGLQHISPDPHVHKYARPRTLEGLQAGVPTKHLAGLQISLDDDPQVIEDNSHLQPTYFERDFKKWQSPAPIRVLGLRRRVFWGILIATIIILIAVTAGIAVGVTSAQKKAAENKAKEREQADAIAAQSRSTSSTDFPTTSSTTLTSSAARPTNGRENITYTQESSHAWSTTLQTVPIFSGSISPGVTPSYYTTATVTAQREKSTDNPSGMRLVDCPQKNGTIFQASVALKYQKLCYQSFTGLKAYHWTSMPTLDDCIDSCAHDFYGANEMLDPYKCYSVSWTANQTFSDMNNGTTMNCFFYSTKGEGSPGDFLSASAVLWENDLLPAGVSG